MTKQGQLNKKKLILCLLNVPSSFFLSHQNLLSSHTKRWWWQVIFLTDHPHWYQFSFSLFLGITLSALMWKLFPRKWKQSKCNLFIFFVFYNEYKRKYTTTQKIDKFLKAHHPTNTHTHTQTHQNHHKEWLNVQRMSSSWWHPQIVSSHSFVMITTTKSEEEVLIWINLNYVVNATAMIRRTRRKTRREEWKLEHALEEITWILFLLLHFRF